MTPKLCLNMIVRNEADRIIRALTSVGPYIETFAILDTGSTDDTVELITRWAAERDIRGVVGAGAFVNFSQARNQALDIAHSWCQNHYAHERMYHLLMDADMELKVTDQRVFDRLAGEAYEVMQRAGGSSYSNMRLLRAGSPARYIGVTHEYLGVPSSGLLDGVHFVDHADGANRVYKYDRDIKLLTEDLDRDPNNARSWFYLANTYRDCGRPADAVEAYRKAVALGDWDEEVWNAQVHLAGCLKAQGLHDAFVAEALKAYQMRPQRAEVLHDLAKHFRERGENAAAMLFAEKGVTMERPDDRLFVADWVYEWGLREEYAIAGYYQEDTRERAFKINNALALDASVPHHVRGRARRDAVFFLPKLAQVCPSARYKQIEFVTKPGFVAMNPCITRGGAGLEVLLRTVNYQIDADGRYMIGPKQCGDAPIETENYLLKLDTQLNMESYADVVWDRPAPKFPLVVGLEDMRIFWLNGERHFYANVREQREDGQCVQYHGLLRHRFGQPDIAVVEAAVPISDGAQTEKNWVPFQYGGACHELVYRLDTLGVLEHNALSFEKTKRDLAVDNISGSSQWVSFRLGMLAIVHESVTHPHHGRRVYQHRFAWTNGAFGGLRLSLPFCFHDVQIEFCAGLADDGSKLIASFGERDEKAWLVTLDYGDVRCALGL